MVCGLIASLNKQFFTISGPLFLVHEQAVAEDLTIQLLTEVHLCGQSTFLHTLLETIE